MAKLSELDFFVIARVMEKGKNMVSNEGTFRFYVLSLSHGQIKYLVNIVRISTSIFKYMFIFIFKH
jgi:hypothetical protein